MYCIVKFAEFAGKDQRDFAGEFSKFDNAVHTGHTYFTEE